jgi:hypothetical protein
MNLAKSMCEFYKKYKKPLVLLAIIVLVYHLYKSSIMQEGYSSSTQCSNYSKCSDCVKNFDGNSKSPCWWSNDKGCSAFVDKGYSRTCTQPDPPPSPPEPIPPFGPPGPIPPGPIIIPPGPDPTNCNKATNCQSCLNSNCFWGDSDQKCSSTFKAGYGKICSGNNNGTNCPKCEECPKLTLLKTPTFITS